MRGIDQAEAGKQRQKTGKDGRPPAGDQHREYDRQHEQKEVGLLPKNRVCRQANEIGSADSGDSQAVSGESGLGQSSTPLRLAFDRNAGRSRPCTPTSRRHRAVVRTRLPAGIEERKVLLVRVTALWKMRMTIAAARPHCVPMTTSPADAPKSPDAGAAGALLRIRRIPIDTYPENTAFLLRHGNGYSAEQYQALRKIRIWSCDAEILATLALVDDETIVGRGEIGLGEQAFRRLGCAEGTAVAIEQARPPASLEFVRRKIDGDTLGDGEIAAIIRDIAVYRYSPMEIGAFLVACAGFMTTQETLSLTRAMVDVGNRLRWQSPLVVDKHCIGGIPGNRTSMIIVPIVAAHGLICPKTSSRAITSPSGTADTMEVLAEVDLSEERLAAVVAQEKAVLAWGGRVNLSPADDVLISVERPLRLDTHEQMVASILSKKARRRSS